MRQTVAVLMFGVLMVLAPAPAVQADERANWGVAVSVGADSGSHMLLLRNDEGFQVVAVDPFGAVHGSGLGAMTLSDIRPGDRVDYALSTWAGVDVAEVLHVTPYRQAEVRH